MNGVQFEPSLNHWKGFEMYILKMKSHSVKRYETQVMTKIMTWSYQIINLAFDHQNLGKHE